jgi:hypothetical protein
MAGFFTALDLVLLLPVALAAAFLFWRGRRGKPAGLAANAIVVDGSNVMYWGGEPSALVLTRVLRALERRDLSPIVFFDANVGYKLGDHYMDDAEMASLAGLPQSSVFVVDKGVIADEIILNFASKHSLRVVSNDQYRDWRVAFPAISGRGKLVKGRWQQGTVIFDKMA